MILNDLTPDNLLLSRTKICEFSSISEVVIEGKTPIDERVASLVRDSIAESTRRAYLSDLAHFESWGGQVPATDQLIASYLAAHAEILSTATLQRRVASLSKAHRALGTVSPTNSELVRAVLRGIRRNHTAVQKQAKPLLRDDLLVVLDAIGNGLKDVRDKALLLVGFAGGFRRSELVGLDATDIEPVRQGIIIHLRRSKTDQEGLGRKIGIPLGRTRHCPVTAIEEWRTRSTTSEGPLFRPVDRHGVIGNHRLSGEAVSLVVRDASRRPELIRPCTPGIACEPDWRPSRLRLVSPLGRSGSRPGTPRTPCSSATSVMASCSRTTSRVFYSEPEPSPATARFANDLSGHADPGFRDLGLARRLDQQHAIGRSKSAGCAAGSVRYQQQHGL